jgi:hypothetical protein
MLQKLLPVNAKRSAFTNNASLGRRDTPGGDDEGGDVDGYSEYASRILLFARRLATPTLFKTAFLRARP